MDARGLLTTVGRSVISFFFDNRGVVPKVFLDQRPNHTNFVKSVFSDHLKCSGWSREIESRTVLIVVSFLPHAMNEFRLVRLICNY